MIEAEQQTIRLLTEMRDIQREYVAYRRSKIDESLEMQARAMETQKRAVHLQRVGLAIVILTVLVGVAFLYFLSKAGGR